jgi:hypothetical protein
MFPKRIFMFDDVPHKFTAVTHFFDCETTFDQRPTGNILFRCKVNRCVLHSEIGKFTNLNSHLNFHEETLKWLCAYSFLTKIFDLR